MQTMTRTRRPFRASITENGLVPTKRCEVLARHGYYFGGSSSPSFVLVLAVTDDYVTYCDAYRLESRREQRWIFEDLATRAGETMRQQARQAAKDAETADTSKAWGRLAVQNVKVTSDRAAAHGAPVNLADYARVRVEVTGEGDIYSPANAFGVLAEYSFDAPGRAVVECDAASVPLMAAAGLTVVSVETMKVCPTV